MESGESEQNRFFLSAWTAYPEVSGNVMNGNFRETATERKRAGGENSVCNANQNAK